MTAASGTIEPSSETGIEELTQEELARIVLAFRGEPKITTPTLRYVRGSADGTAPPYVWDEESAMVYILD